MSAAASEQLSEIEEVREAEQGSPAEWERAASSIRNSELHRMDFLDPLQDPGTWDREISGYPNVTPFHSAAWAKVLNRSYGHRPFYSRLSDRDQQPLAHVPLMELRSPITGRRGISLPFSDLCPPLTLGGCDFGEIRNTLSQLARERAWKYLEWRGEETQSSEAPSNALPATFLGHSLNLSPGPESLIDQCSSSVRRALRKAERSDLTVKLERSEPAMRDFYRLHALTRRRHGLPPQPYRFFQTYP